MKAVEGSFLSSGIQGSRSSDAMLAPRCNENGECILNIIIL